MGRHVPLHLPFNIASPEGDSQDRTGTVPFSSYRSILAVTVMVRQADQAPGLAPTDLAPQVRHHFTATVRDLTSETGRSSIDLLATVQ